MTDDSYRIEADCLLRECDSLSLDLVIAREALEKIAAKRPNRRFDPWAADVASRALAELDASAPAVSAVPCHTQPREER